MKPIRSASAWWLAFLSALTMPVWAISILLGLGGYFTKSISTGAYHLIFLALWIVGFLLTRKCLNMPTKHPYLTHLHGGAAECTDRVNAGGVPAGSTRKLAVPAGKNLVFTVGMDPKGIGATFAFGAAGSLIVATNRGCTPTIDFVPEAGKSYVFRMTSDAAECSYQFYSKSASNTPESNVVFVKREWVRAMSESGPFCKK